jgi:hypothetical protein
MIVTAPPMPDQSKNPPEEIVGDAARVFVCGDCRQRLDAATLAGHGCMPASRDSGDWYCAYCGHPARGRLECPECGAVICPDCGAVLELADELGIG